MHLARASVSGSPTHSDAPPEPAAPKARPRTNGIFRHEKRSSTHNPRAGTKKDCVEHRVTNDGIVSCPLPSQRDSMTDPNQAAILRTRFWKMEDGCHEHRMKSFRRHGKWFDMMQNLKEQQTLYLALD